MQFDYFNISYAISFVIGVLEIIAFLCLIKYRLHNLTILPRALRFYFYSSCIPFVILNAILSAYISVVYLIHQTQQTLDVEIFRNIITFGSQQCRSVFFSISIERIFATLYLEKYTLPNDLSLFWFLTFCNYLATFIYFGFTLYCKYVPKMYHLFELSNFYLFFAHALTLVICTILHFLNKKMYKLSAYRITLKKRYQIYENIKILNFLFPIIIIYTLITPLCSIVAIISNTYDLWTNPNCLWHISYNLPFLLIFVRHFLKNSSHKIEDVESTAVTSIKNAFGKNLPMAVSNDKYFNDLKSVWK